MNFLEKILQEKETELSAAKVILPLEKLKEIALGKISTIKRRKFGDIFLAGRLALIAEIKLKSPSEGILTQKTHLDIAGEYAASEADAISILTESKHFNGRLEYITEVRKILSQPILRKDFIIDEYQVYETAAAEADAFLLIAAILNQAQLKTLINLGKELGLDSLVEIHNKADLEKALAADAKIIGINNRDLTSLKINLETSRELAPLIPKGTFIVSESGIKKVEDVRFLKALGIHGILIGSSIVKSYDPVGAIRQLKNA